MNGLFVLAFIATILDGLFAGMAVQKLVVELPARKKIGAALFAKYARASDLGNGLYVYPALAIGGVVLKVILFPLVYPLGLEFPAGLALLCGLAVLATTAFAAPNMLKLRSTGDDEARSAALLEKFVFYSNIRLLFLLLQFVALLWMLCLLATASL